MWKHLGEDVSAGLGHQLRMVEQIFKQEAKNYLRSAGMVHEKNFKIRALKSVILIIKNSNDYYYD